MIKELIDEFYSARQKDREKIAFWVSDAGKCLRAIWFSMKNYPKKPTEPRFMRVFEHGNHTHMRIMNVLFSLGLVQACEIEIPENEIIHGRADAIVVLENKPYVVEIKSINTAKFKKDEPDEDHVKQIQLYMYFFKIPRGILIYENKDTQELKEFPVEFNESIVNEILFSFNNLKEKIEKNIPPEIPKDLEDWRCEYCPYLENCEKIEEKNK